MERAARTGHRREILDVPVGGEQPVGAIVEELTISQPQVSKHLRVLSEVGLVKCRAVGRRRLYRLNPRCLRPVSDWMAKYELMGNERLDDDLSELQDQEGRPEPQRQGGP